MPPGDVEGFFEQIEADGRECPLPAVRSLHLDQPIGAVGLEAVDVVACPIAILFGNPPDPAREFVLSRLLEHQALVAKHDLLTGASERPVPVIAPGDVKLARDRQHLFKLCRWRCIAEGWSRPDP